MAEPGGATSGAAGGGYRPLPIGGHEPSARPTALAPSVAVLATDALRIGRVHMPPSHPLFRSGPVPGDMVVFPRAPFLLARSGDRTRTIDASMAVTYTDGQEFERRGATAAGTQADWIAISPRLRDEFGGLAYGGRFIATAYPLTAATFLGAERLFRRVRQPGTDPFAVEELAIELLRSILAPVDPMRRRPRAGGARRPTEAQHDLVERARLLLGRDLAIEPSLESMAQELGASSGHLCRAFRRVTGQSMRAYRRDLRLRLARRWLDDTSHDIARIALELGFSSHAHFTMWFRRVWGTPPSAYRAAR